MMGKKNLVIADNPEPGRAACSLCGGEHKRHKGPELFTTEGAPACWSCGGKRAPALVKMLREEHLFDDLEDLSVELPDLGLDIPGPDNNNNRF